MLIFALFFFTTCAALNIAMNILSNYNNGPLQLVNVYNIRVRVWEENSIVTGVRALCLPLNLKKSAKCNHLLDGDEDGALKRTVVMLQACRGSGGAGEK